MTPNTEASAPEVPAAITPESTLPPGANDKTVWIADLDSDDVLVGFREVKLSDAPDGFVEVPHHCDLLTDGRYRYSREKARFEPITHVVIAKGDGQQIKAMTGRLLLGLCRPSDVPEAVRKRAEFLLATDPKYVEQLRKKYAPLIAGMKA
jgi:hypothetical protein